MKLNKQIQPAQYVPLCPEDFIGPAHDIAKMMKAKADALRPLRDRNCKYVLTGQPGIGKTALAEYFAVMLTGEKITKGQSLHIESVNGRAVDVPLIRRWQEEAKYVPNGWRVKILNELDTFKQDAQDLTLTYLDELADRIAVIGTSNVKLGDMDERFHSRFQQFHVKPPEHTSIAALLKRFGLASKSINEITLGCGGNVRAALLDAQSILDIKLA